MKGYSKKVRSQKSAVRSQKRAKRKQINNPSSLPVEWFSEELRNLKERNLFRTFHCIESSPGSRISIKGQTFLNMSSNDYLGLSGHPDIIKTAVSGLNRFGFGSGASRLLSGTYSPHVKLEQRIAKFKKTQAALVFNTGYAANTGIIPALTGANDVIFSDQLNHASIVDGTRLSHAEVKIYRHRDVDHLEHLLKESIHRKTVRRRLIITDTVFSMDGDIAPLKSIVWLCNKYGAILIIDDAHGTGVLGKTGRGGLEHLGMTSDTIIQMGTLSKAAGCYGAFVAGKKDVINVLINKARSFIYSTSLPPAVCEAGIKAIDIIDSGSINLRKKLWKNRERLYQGLNNMGYDTLGSETPIVPMLIGDAKDTLKLARHLYKNNVFSPAIRPPTVSEGKCRIRMSVTAGHTGEDIDLVLESLRKYK